MERRWEDGSGVGLWVVFWGLCAISGSMWEAQEAILSYSEELVQFLFRLDKSPTKIRKDATMAARSRHFGYRLEVASAHQSAFVSH